MQNLQNTQKNKEKWIEKVKNLLEMGGKSECTFENYKSHIYRFLNNYDESVDFNNINEEEIYDYIKENYIDLKRASSTINVALASIKYLYSICFKKELNPKLLPNKKLIKIIPDILSKEDFIEIFNNEENLKFKCYLLLAFCSGLRSIEIARLRIEDINASEHKIKVLGKRNKERYTILPDITIKCLRLYCKYNLISDKTGYLFKGYKGREYTSKQSISDRFNNGIRKKYNLPKTITFHSLRHSFATYFLKNGGNIVDLQHLLGHKNLSTTSIYIHYSQDFNHLEGIRYVD